MAEQRLIVISNRIPTEEEPSGGLVVALHDCLNARGGIWIGSSGGPVEHPRAGLTKIAEGAYTRYTFDLSQEDYDTYYLGYSNAVLWPVFHRRADLMQVRPGYAQGYLDVNARVADMVAEFAGPDDTLWVQDYHFLPLAAMLRERGVQSRIGFFLHIPFPEASHVPALPDAQNICSWVASYDVFGLQTEADVERCENLFRHECPSFIESDGTISVAGRRCRPMACPIGIDAEGYRATAETSKVGKRLFMHAGQKLVLGVDRLDYSKGLVQRFEGFGAYLGRRSNTDEPATLLQVAPPSRQGVDAYKDMRMQLDLTAGSINGDYGEIDWTPIRYVRRSLPRDELAGLYRRADAVMVTPLADGMNLVAKEFVAAQDPDDAGVLILSHFAGAAEQLTDALLVNPYDADEMAAALERALTMPLEERKARHARLWENVRDQDVDWWTGRFLGALCQQRAVEAA